MNARSIHAVLTMRPDGLDHRPSSICPCQPVTCHDLEEPSRLVFIHRWYDARSTGDRKTEAGDSRPDWGHPQESDTPKALPRGYISPSPNAETSQ